jgi:hypothetical protein
MPLAARQRLISSDLHGHATFHMLVCKEKNSTLDERAAAFLSTRNAACKYHDCQSHVVQTKLASEIIEPDPAALSVLSGPALRAGIGQARAHTGSVQSRAASAVVSQPESGGPRLRVGAGRKPAEETAGTSRCKQGT